MKLDIEQREDLLSLVDHEGYPVLLNVLEQLCANIANRVLSYNLSDGPDGLIVQKAQYEGARKLTTDLLATVDKLKAKQKG